MINDKRIAYVSSLSRRYLELKKNEKALFMKLIVKSMKENQAIDKQSENKKALKQVND